MLVVEVPLEGATVARLVCESDVEERRLALDLVGRDLPREVLRALLELVERLEDVA